HVQAAGPLPAAPHLLLRQIMESAAIRLSLEPGAVTEHTPGILHVSCRLAAAEGGDDARQAQLQPLRPRHVDREHERTARPQDAVDLAQQTVVGLAGPMA